MSRLAQCHGCHGMLGGGLHVGSAIGKNVCTFPHSSLCRGGILDSDGWRACPPDFAPVGGNFSQFVDQNVAQPEGHYMQPGAAHSLVSTANLDQSAQDFGTPTNYVSHFANNLVEESVSTDTDAADLARFQQQANGEGARRKVIQERLRGRVW